MARKNWQNVKDTFHDALRLDPGERGPFLDKACNDDIEFRIEVESLLISLAEAKSFLEQPIIGETPKPDSAWRLNDGEIISHYRIVSPIASGGMGEVYLAEDEKLGRRVALKILPEDILADRNRLRRFRREAEAISALNHPNILTIFEFGSDNDVHFLASEFVKGETLRARLKNGRLTLHDTLEIATQIASALCAAHEAGVVHRDIKPENVMIRDDGYVKVLDFGLAKLTEQMSWDSVNVTKEFLSQPGVIMGTVSYMSPEQARARSTDARSDIFSFGVVLFEMLTGHVPFAGETTPDVIAGIIQSEPRTASSYNGSVPDEMDRIIAKCLEKDRDIRYQTAADLLADLKRLSKSSELTAKTTPFLSKSRGFSSTSGTAATELISNAQTTESKIRWSIRSAALPVLAIFLMTGAAVWLFWQFNKNTDSDSFDALRPVRLAAWKSGLASFYTDYRASHNGRMIAYSSTQNGESEEIYVKQIAGGEAIRMTKGEWKNHSPIWSPDDQHIAYVSRREGQAGIYVCPFLGGAAVSLKMIGGGKISLRHWSKDGAAIFYELDGNLYRLDLETKEAEQLTDFPVSPPLEKYFSFSPDEERIAYCDNRAGEGDIWIMERTGGTPQRLTSDKDNKLRPRWHPDGKRILYNVIRDRRKHINLVYTDGRPPVQVTRGDGDYELIDVSADGTKIFYTTWEKRSDISRVKIESGEEFEVAAGLESEFWTDVSPDGRSILFQTNAAPHLTPFLHDSSVIIVKSLTDQSPQLSLKGYNPRWLPDSRRIAFLRWQKAEQKFNLWLVNTDTGEEKKLTTDGVSPLEYGMMPVDRFEIGNFNWSPDGKQFVYLDSKKQNIWTASVELPEKFNQANNDNPNVLYYSPLWSPDGEQIVYISVKASERTQKWSIWLTEQSKATEIFSTPASLRLLGWSASGKELFLEMTDGAMISSPLDVKLVQVSTTGEDRIITTFKNIYVSSMTLSTDGKAVAFTARQDDVDNIWTASTNGGEAKKITANRNSRLFFGSPEWTPDGKTIFFDKQDQVNTISMFENF